MAKLNGRLTAKVVREWFSAMEFEAQRDMLDSLSNVHAKVRQVKINSLQRQLAELQNGSSNGPVASKVAKRGSKKGSVKVKYRDPKSGDTWSGRGRMARWLSEKVNAGEKADKYLA